MDRGWIKLHRKLADNDLWLSGERFTQGQAWVDLLLLANHAPQALFIRGVEIKVERGQLAWSKLNLCKRWKWKDQRTLDKFLNRLENKEMIQTKANNVTTLISIINYDLYQNNSLSDTDQVTDQNTERLHTKLHTNKNVKNLKNDKKKTFSPEIMKLSTLLGELILRNNPSYRSLLNGSKENTLLKWADPIGKLHRIDKQSLGDIETVIRWAQADDFWKGNILSGDTLRKQWDKLKIKAIGNCATPAKPLDAAGREMKYL